MATGADAGKKMIRDYGLHDPSLRVRDRLISVLQHELGLSRFDVVPDLLENDSLDATRARFPKRLVLDFKTDAWGLFPIGELFAPGQRRLFYSMRARLLRGDATGVIWQGLCATETDRSAARHWTDLIANEGALLRARLQEIADACAERLRAQMLTGDKEVTVK
jgi:hypothetical protein